MAAILRAQLPRHVAQHLFIFLGQWFLADYSLQLTLFDYLNLFPQWMCFCAVLVTVVTVKWFFAESCPLIRTIGPEAIEFTIEIVYRDTAELL